MSDSKRLVLDANILLRAVFAGNTKRLLDRYHGEVEFHSPRLCFEDAIRHIPMLAARKILDRTAGFRALDRLAAIIEVVEITDYQQYGAAARERIDYRDPDDWPILAASLLLACPIWTEDQDFFGTGVATWNTRNVEIDCQVR